MIFKKNSSIQRNKLLILEEPSAILAPYRIPFVIGDQATESARQYLEQCREQLKKLHSEHFPSDQSLSLYSLNIDDLILTLYQRADWLFQESHPHRSTRCALFALGGYGRREMNIRSDIDLLFVYKDKPEDYVTALTDAILYVLWDLGLEVGSATRSLKDCKQMMKEDIATQTSYLDARYLAGDKQIAEEFLKLVWGEYSSKSGVQEFYQKKNKENQERLKRFGGSVYILEPNLKESEGGLRDFQTLLWFAKVLLQVSKLEDLVEKKVLTTGALKELVDARNFLWRVRNALHFRVSKKNDQLTFQFQEEIAKELGFKDEGGVLAVEKFMQTYYQHAANIKRITHFAISAMIEPPEKRLKSVSKKITEHLDDDFAVAEDQIIIKQLDLFEKKPLNLLKVFDWAQQKSLDIEEGTRRGITKHLYLVNEEFIHRREVNEVLKSMFGRLKGLGKILHLMHELRFLDRIIPEFGEVLYRVQHDVYHIYTVDTHSIIAVEELSRLQEGKYDEAFPLFKQVLGETKRHDLLAWGVFFHDVGKGRGKNHSIVGAEMALRATQRMAYSDKDCETVEFLVKSHLLMPHLAQRRDLDDVNLIIQFAKSMQHMDNLNMLFILTWADIRAVGPEVWTPWKGTLLSELYNRTRRVLESGNFTQERVIQIAEEVKKSALLLVKEKVPVQIRDEYLKNMPLKYFLGNSPQEISEHLELAEEALQEQHLVCRFHILEKDNLNEMVLFTLSTPGLLAKVAGILSANDMNILDAKQSVSKSGWALLSIRFTDSQGQMIREPRRWGPLEKDFANVLEGRERVASLIESRKKPSWMQKTIARTFPSSVEVDNDVSAYYTVIDIYTHDRMGLLYEILTALSNLGLYVDVSKISTKVDQVADVFYVKDIFGQKITQSEKLRRIQSELLKVVEGETA